MDDIFGDVIHSYSRAQAIEDGVLVDLSAGETAKLVKEAGFRYPVAMTSAAWNATVGLGGKWVPDADGETLELPECQDAIGRTWDVLTMLRFGMRGCSGPECRFEVRVWNRRVRVVRLKAVCGPSDDGSPCITIMLPNED